MCRLYVRALRCAGIMCHSITNTFRHNVSEHSRCADFMCQSTKMCRRHCSTQMCRRHGSTEMCLRHVVALRCAGVMVALRCACVMIALRCAGVVVALRCAGVMLALRCAGIMVALRCAEISSKRLESYTIWQTNLEPVHILATKINKLNQLVFISNANQMAATCKMLPKCRIFPHRHTALSAIDS
jgi:hypothetical protein